MTEGIITIPECLKIMDSGAVFSLTCITWDERRPENSGETKEYAECVMLAHLPKLLNMPPKRTETRVESLKNNITGQTRKVDADTHFVRDVQPLTGGTIAIGHPVRVHPRLFLQFNGKKVMP